VPNVLNSLKRFDSLEGVAGGVTKEGILLWAEDLNYSQADRATLHALLTNADHDPAAAASIYRTSIRGRLEGEQVGPEAPVCTIEHDDLITDDQDWPADKILNLALARRVFPTKSVAVVTTVKNEGLGMLEWVAYHLAIGIERIFVYYNDNDDGSTALLMALDQSGYIESIENSNSGQVSVQAKAIEHSLHLLPELRQYRWAFYLDADEFIVSRIGPAFDVPALLARVDGRSVEEPIDAVMFNWKWFGSENVLERTPGLILDRFVHSKPNPHIKCLVRLSNIISMRHLHFPIMVNPERIVGSDLRRVSNQQHHTGRFGPIYDIGQINHYWNKSFEEFLIKKSRGRGQTDQRLDFQSFFDWGTNETRGGFDPPPDNVMIKTRQLLEKMRESEDIRAALSEIELSFKRTMEGFRKSIDVIGIHSSRGRTLGSAL
jgi:hypothetical protein